MGVDLLFRLSSLNLLAVLTRVVFIKVSTAEDDFRGQACAKNILIHSSRGGSTIGKVMMQISLICAPLQIELAKDGAWGETTIIMSDGLIGQLTSKESRMSLSETPHQTMMMLGFVEQYFVLISAVSCHVVYGGEELLTAALVIHDYSLMVTIWPRRDDDDMGP